MNIQEYSCHENYWGSDHRPVYVHVQIVTQPQHFISPASLLTPETPIQGHGELKFAHCMLEFIPERLFPILRDKCRFPVFL